MKRMGVVLLLVVLISGCDANDEMEEGMALRSRILKAEQCEFQAVIMANYGQTAQEFTMQCIFDPQGNLRFTVLKPESIGGIQGTVDSSSGTFTFDDTVLYFPLMADGRLSPAAAPWILMKTLRSGYLSSACTEEEYLRLSMNDSYQEDALSLDIWIHPQGAPAFADILWEGRRILTISVKDFVIS